MYRTLVIAALYFHTASTAPPDNGNSQIAYSNLQPIVGDSSVVKPSIETKQVTAEVSTSTPVIHNINEADSLNTSTPHIVVDTEPLLKGNGKGKGIGNDTKTAKEVAVEVSIIPEVNEDQTITNVYIDPSNDTDGNNDDKEDIIPSETKLEREARDFKDLSTSSYETETVYATERFDELLEDTKTSPKYAVKLDNYNKYASHLKNRIESSGRKKFRSRCRCEKIWNCPKLQISIPRCPEEQFMCCF